MSPELFVNIEQGECEEESLWKHFTMRLCLLSPLQATTNFEMRFSMIIDATWCSAKPQLSMLSLESSHVTGLDMGFNNYCI